MMYCFLQSRWYRGTRLLNNMVRYYRLSSLLMKSETVRLIRSTMLVQWAAPKPKVSAKKKKGESASSTTLPTPTPTTNVESAPRLSATAKGKQPTRATTPPTEQKDVQRTEAEQLKIVLKRSRQETHISQQH
nr:hypothetical protein [Tanacetum cinerariifolium]